MYDGVGQEESLAFDRSRACINPPQERDRIRRMACGGHELVCEAEALCNGSDIGPGHSRANLLRHTEADVAAIAGWLTRAEIVGSHHEAIVSTTRGQRFV